ncbi:MAG: lysophospholipid acyltransferase family protein [Hyphomicrobiales bacterium]|nr:lysophospholipid acyltransferase family protein [Hyphomicrobiales bacterium]
MALAIFKKPFVQEAVGRLLAGYLKLVQRTNRMIIEPEGVYGRIVRPDLPVIVAMWHGQHLMVPFGRPDWMKASSLVSRHGDGEFNAIALRELGIGTIRGSGAHGRKVREKGGASAFLAMTRALASDTTMVLTADVPKVARVAGIGIVKLAQVSGRPIYPVAVVTSRRHAVRNWDCTTIGLPFGRCGIVVGEAIHVAREADAAAMEAARLAVETGLDAVHARAFALVGRDDPGGALIAANREVARLKASAGAATSRVGTA